MSWREFVCEITTKTLLTRNSSDVPLCLSFLLYRWGPTWCLRREPTPSYFSVTRTNRNQFGCVRSSVVENDKHRIGTFSLERDPGKPHARKSQFFTGRLKCCAPLRENAKRRLGLYTQAEHTHTHTHTNYIAIKRHSMIYGAPYRRFIQQYKTHYFLDGVHPVLPIIERYYDLRT